MKPSGDEASTSVDVMNALARRAEPLFDIISAVRGLHGLTSQQLSKLIRDAGNNVLTHIGEDGSRIQIDIEKFARFLPAHLISVVMAWDRGKATYQYLLCGVLLLHSMCDLASRVPRIEQILLEDVKVSVQLIDLVIYLLAVLAAYTKAERTANDMVLLHSALVACSLKLLTVTISPQFQEVAQVLVAYRKVDLLMDAAFSAVFKDIRFLRFKLSADKTTSTTNSPSDEETLIHLYQQCESSLQFLHSLCQQKLILDQLVKNKELCGKGGVLLLVEGIMTLKISHLYNGSSSVTASVSRMKSKALSTLLHLCEAESSYLDEVASTPGNQIITKTIGIEFLELLKKMFGIDSKHSSEKVYPKGQLELNAMRLADIFSDDSNFRSFITENFTETLAAVFLFPHGEFLSDWCTSNLPTCEDDATMEVPPASYAHHRTSLLIKVMANLHCFAPSVCQDEKDFFLNKFVQCLRMEGQNVSDGFSSGFDTEKVATVRKNLGSLLSHAESLIPGFLNEDDVQLLRLFISQLESVITTGASGNNRIQEGQGTWSFSPPSPGKAALNHNGSTSDNIQGGMQENNDAVQKVGKDLSDANKTNEKILSSGVGERHEEIDPEPEKDSQDAEIGGQDSRGENNMELMDVDKTKESYLADQSNTNENAENANSDEKQQKKRKRTVMNEKQIAMMESALVDEPDMHRNSASLRSWAEKLSLHGSEVTVSKLKNWLNNRKSKLARAAKDGRGLTSMNSLDRQGDQGGPLQFDSPDSANEDVRVPPSREP